MTDLPPVSNNINSNNNTLIVISRLLPDDLTWKAKDDDNANDDANDRRVLKPVLPSIDVRNDHWDTFNHPRHRRAIILNELANCKFSDDENQNHDHTAAGRTGVVAIHFRRPSQPALDLHAYLRVHTPDLVDFLSTAWRRWDDLKGQDGQDPGSTLKVNAGAAPAAGNGTDDHQPLPLVPGNVPLPRDAEQRPSQNVMGQVGYYCTDTCTPIFGELVEELTWDVAVVEDAVRHCVGNGSGDSSEIRGSTATVLPLVYALTTHPGHHAARDSFGGYCYGNHAALAARLLQEHLEESSDMDSAAFTAKGGQKVAILDVDYHCGNGTASIFYDDPSVVVVSIHCHPDYDYPFHSGFEDERGGSGDGSGATLHLPLMPGATWADHYETALQKAMDFLFGNDHDGDATSGTTPPVQALVVSLGLDTLAGDPCAIRRAGFQLKGDDYKAMGQMIGAATAKAASRLKLSSLPCVVIQEGGYKMDDVPAAAADMLMAMAAARQA